MTKFRIRPLLAAIALLATFASAAAVTPTAPENGAMFGFSPAAATAQQSLEQRFDAQLDPADQRRWLQQMASQPNQVGSPHDKANAEFMLQQFRAWGWDARIETFNVLYPTPIRSRAGAARRPALHGSTERAAGGRRRHLIHSCRRAARHTTCTAATATSPRRWSTSTRACPTTTRSWRGAASTCAARSSSPATAVAGAG